MVFIWTAAMTEFVHIPKRTAWNFKDITGKKYGRWTVLYRYSKNIKTPTLERPKCSSPAYMCRCECGKEVVVVGKSLWSGDSKSCGCLKRDRQIEANHGMTREKSGSFIDDRVEARIRNVISMYRSNAKEKRLPFELTYDMVSTLIQGPCTYCGIEPSNTSVHYKYKDEVFHYSGIDRIDSSMGYIPGNVVSCCKICNISKNNMSKNDFTEWVKRVYEHTVAGPQGIYFKNTINGPQKISMPIPISFYESLFGKHE
jgi:hypothetical protein